MSKQARDKQIRELPERLRLIINRETEDGLERFRPGDFESRLASRLKATPKEGSVRTNRRWFWVPAMGATGAAILALVAFLWLGSPRRSAPPAASGAIGLTLGRLPGFRSLDISIRPEFPSSEAPSLSATIVSRVLVSAAHEAASGPATPGLSPQNLKPRYSLQQKMEIIFEHRMIERALSTYKNKFGEA